MGKKILVAEPHEVIRIGLRTILEQSEQAIDIHEAFSYEAAREMLHSASFDLIIVHQSLVKEYHWLAPYPFILLVDEPDIELCLDAYRHKARGYLSTSLSSELLFTAMHTSKGGCLLDPVFLPWMVEHLFTYMQNTRELNALSPREREIAQLMKDGLDRRTIAQQLHISNATLKTHIKNIVRKQEEMQMGSGSLFSSGNPGKLN